MSDDATRSSYLSDLGAEIASLARTAASEPRRATDAFAAGRAYALYEVVSLMQQQARSFGLGPQDIGQADLDPERDLLPPTDAS